MNTTYGIFWWLIVGILVGWLTGRVMRGAGVYMDLILGLIGALGAGWIFSALEFTRYDLLGSVIVAFIGAVIVVALFRVLTRHSVRWN